MKLNGEAAPLQGEGRGFESHHLHQVSVYLQAPGPADQSVYLGVWSNGKTRASNPLDPGSIPGAPAKWTCSKRWSCSRLLIGLNAGSIPVTPTILHLTPGQ